jgi:hypothetical protein
MKIDTTEKDTCSGVDEAQYNTCRRCCHGGCKESYSTLLYHWGFLPEVGGAMIRGMSVSTPPSKQPTQQVTAVATMDGS